MKTMEAFTSGSPLTLLANWQSSSSSMTVDVVKARGPSSASGSKVVMARPS